MLPKKRRSRRPTSCIVILFGGIIGIVLINGLFAGFVAHQYNDDRTHQFGMSKQLQKVAEMPPQESSENSAGFIHIGKTGGSTISTMIRNGCSSFSGGPCRNITNESAISKFVEHYYHVTDFWRLPESNHKMYLISVRDPFDRTVSALLYHHPDNAKAYHLKLGKKQAYFGPVVFDTCFPTVEAFAQLFPTDTNKASSDCDYPYPQGAVVVDNCQALACAAIHSKARFFSHLFFNYRNILRTKMPNEPPRSIYVIRKEAFWDDWEQVNEIWGQEVDAGDYVISEHHKVARNVTGIQVPVTRDISDDGRRRLCIELEDEYKAYFDLLRRAINIDRARMRQCVDFAKKSCPILDIESMAF